MRVLYVTVIAVTLMATLVAPIRAKSIEEENSKIMEKSQLNILYMGNSHTKRHNVPEYVKAIVEAAKPDVKVNSLIAPGILFLDQRWNHGPSRKMLKDKKITHVVLQAQKYSQSRRKLYSTKEAKKLVSLAKEQGSQAILFPEWGQRGRQWEGQYVHDIYAGIANESGACLAPVGLVWDHFLLSHKLGLHDMDGNHANENGAYLTAIVLAQSILETPAVEFDNSVIAPVDVKTQEFMRDAAAKLYKSGFTQCKL
ncbi:hypothetical protein [Pseudoalteromonas rhizosphaerae]|uniref:hypothetical protein n=1 Tax=Pseudoalteromonas rhizosphaerae TaxID=2518973 RepID=UPI00214748E9|nr:hypothetical protein [Pseudoalteromonas rhizosphaerae]